MRVVVRKEIDGGLLAVFPDNIFEGTNQVVCVSMRDGHSCCSLGYCLSDTKSVRQDEEKAMLDHLTCLGYENLKPYKKFRLNYRGMNA